MEDYLPFAYRYGLIEQSTSKQLAEYDDICRRRNQTQSEHHRIEDRTDLAIEVVDFAISQEDWCETWSEDNQIFANLIPPPPYSGTTLQT